MPEPICAAALSLDSKMRTILLLLLLLPVLVPAGDSVNSELEKIRAISERSKLDVAEIGKMLGAPVAKPAAPKSKMEPAIFYLFSTGMGEASIGSFMDESAAVAKRFPEVQFYGVIRGFPESSLRDFMKRFYNKKRSGFHLKVHPGIFRTAGVSRVPAYLFAECPFPGDFRFRSCRPEYVIRGDITLSEALRIVSDKEGKWSKFIEALK